MAASREVPCAAPGTGPPPAPRLAPPWTAVPLSPAGPTLELLVRWMQAPHVARHWHQEWTAGQWADEISAQLAGSYSRPWLIHRGDDPLAYIEVYRTARDVLAAHYPAGEADVGVHIAIGDESHTGRGLGTAVLRLVAEGLFAADPACRWVVGDPDAGHIVARRAFESAGFVLFGEVPLPHKQAAILIRSRFPGDAAGGDGSYGVTEQHSSYPSGATSSLGPFPAAMSS